MVDVQHVTELINSAIGPGFPDARQDAWATIWASGSLQDDDILRIARDVRRQHRNKAIREQYKLIDLQKPIGNSELTIEQVVGQDDTEIANLLNGGNISPHVTQIGGGLVEVNCDECGTSFRKYRSHLRNHNFCCEDCRLAWWRKHRHTSRRNHTRWVGRIELVDITEAGNILGRDRTAVHYIMRHGKLAPRNFRQGWWFLKSDVVALAAKRAEEQTARATRSHNHHLKKMREWHSQMSREGRCHWCGAPESKERKAVCDKHLAKARANDSACGKRRREKLRRMRLCANCGKLPRRFGYETCTTCSARSALRNKERRADKTWTRLEELKEKGLITIDEAAEILTTHRVSVHNLIKKGLLQVKVHAFRRFYLDNEDVETLQAERDKRLSIDPEMDILRQRITRTPASVSV